MNAGSGFEGWEVVLNGDEEVFELPDIEGATLNVQTRGDSVQLNRMGSDTGSLLVTIVVGDEELEAGDYKPTLFSVTWEYNDHRCLGSPDVTVTDTDPVHGTYAGTLTCNPRKVTPDSGFDVTLSGEFAESM